MAILNSTFFLKHIFFSSGSERSTGLTQEQDYGLIKHEKLIIAEEREIEYVI